MTIKIRRLLFYSLFFLFILIGSVIVFYSYGWRISAENCVISKPVSCIQKTGGLFIETEPKGVVIKIDGKIFKDKSGLIQNGTLIKNLSPKTYQIKIEKDGFYPCDKKVKIESNLVFEIPNIILIPKNLEKIPVPIPKSIDNFWISPQQKIIFSVKNEPFLDAKNNKTLYYFTNSTLSKLKGNEFINFSEDGKKIIVSAEDEKTLKNKIYYLYDLSDLSKTVNLNAILKNLEKTTASTPNSFGEISEIFFHPAESHRLIIKNKKNYIYFLDLNRLKLEIIVKEPVFAWTIKNPNIYYIKSITEKENSTSTGYALASFNLILKTESVITQFPDHLIPRFKNSPIIISPDNKKMALFNKAGEISVYFLENYRFGINKKSGDIINVSTHKEKTIENIFWYKNSYHLLIEHSVSGNSAVNFVEIDDQAPTNKIALIEKTADFHYDLKSNRFYFLADKNLYYFIMKNN